MLTDRPDRPISGSHRTPASGVAPSTSFYWVFTRYGSAEIDPIAIAFFRYERIVVDIAEYGHKIFDLNASASDRLSNLRKLATAFLLDNVIDTAHKYYSSLT